MAAEANDLEAFFLHSIPLLFRQVERNLHGDNLNVLEYFERRLDDHSYVIRSVILQCEQQSASEDFLIIELHVLNLVHEINSLIDQSQDLCDAQRNFASEMGFSCPVELSTGRGRPRFYIPEEVIRGLCDVRFMVFGKKWPKKYLYFTILRR